VRAVVTGANGFVASHLIGHLLDCGDTVLALTRTNHCRLDLSEQLTTGVWDITQPASIGITQQIAEFNPDVVYHLAAISVRSRCGDKEPSAEAIQVNINGTRHVAECCLRLPSVPRLLFTSSVYVYGSRYSQLTQVAEDHPLTPDNGYGKSKLLAEQSLLDLQDRLPVVIARSFQHTGPGQTGSLLIPEWHDKLQSAESPLEVYNLNTWIDYSDARDVAQAYHILATEGEAGQIYNVGSGRAIRSGAIFDTLQKLLSINKSVIESKPGENFLPIANINKILSSTSWLPTHDLDSTLRDFVEDRRSESA